MAALFASKTIPFYATLQRTESQPAHHGADDKPEYNQGSSTRSLELGDFAGLCLVSVGARFIRERKIFGAGLLQHFLFSPPAEDRDQRAQGDDQGDARNQEP
jgi:hypothetical protein